MIIEAKTEYELTADEKGMVQPLIETIERLQKEVQTILTAVTRLRKLEGNWALQGNKLVLVPPPNQNANVPPPNQNANVPPPNQNGNG